MTNAVEDLFVKQSRAPLGSIKQLTVVLEAVAARLDVLERLSRHLAPLSPTSSQQPVQNHSVYAADIIDIIPSQRPNSCLQCLKLGPTVTCKRIVRHVNCKRCSSAGHKDTCSKVCSLVLILLAFLT